jgi:hypothetical protein
MRIFGVLIALKSTLAQAHPGRTANDGCHYCRANWSSEGGARKTKGTVTTTLSLRTSKRDC